MNIIYYLPDFKIIHFINSNDEEMRMTQLEFRPYSIDVHLGSKTIVAHILKVY